MAQIYRQSNYFSLVINCLNKECEGFQQELIFYLVKAVFQEIKNWLKKDCVSEGFLGLILEKGVIE
jgi:hypothetical protein